MKEQSSHKKIALSGLLSAISVIIIFMGSLFQTLDLSAAAIAGLAVLYAMIELGTKYAVLIYGVTSLLGLILLPYKSPVMFFVLFGGIYPIVKPYLHRIKSKVLTYVLKLIFANILFFVIYLTAKHILGLPDDFVASSSNIPLVGTLLFANIVFLVYDFTLDRLVIMYMVRVKKQK